MSRADTIRANVRAILSAAKRRGRGYRVWSPVYPDTNNPVRFQVGRDAFGCKQSGQSVLWWSDFKTTERYGVEEFRRGLWRRFPTGSNRHLMKAEAFNLATQAGRIQANRKQLETAPS